MSKGYISIYENEYGFACSGIFINEQYAREDKPHCKIVIEVDLPEHRSAKLIKAVVTDGESLPPTQESSVQPKSEI